MQLFTGTARERSGQLINTCSGTVAFRTMKPFFFLCVLLGLVFPLPSSAVVLKGQDFDAAIFASGAESGALYFRRTGGAPVIHASTGGTDLGFTHDGLTSTTGTPTPGTDVAAGVAGGHFHIMHYSSTYSGSALDFSNPRTGRLHFDPVDLTGFKDKMFGMDIHDIGSNTGDDDVVVRLLVNGGTTVTLLDTRPQAKGTAGNQTLTHSFNDTDYSVQLLIDILSDDNGDGYGFDNIAFNGVLNPDAPEFHTDTITGLTARATLAYGDSIYPEATDPNGDPLEYAKVDGPAWLTVATNGTLDGIPGLDDQGPNQFTVLVSDNSNGTDTAQLIIQVNDPDGTPPPTPSNTEHYRVTWDNDPGSTATIAWKQISGANGTVYYGTTDFGRSQTNYPNQKTVDKVGNFTIGGTINTCFARLTGLQPDTAYYFVIKDDAGVSPRFWFLTAPDAPKPFTFIGGGDSRSNHPPRRRANRMVAKLRPLFVYFTGDMINSSNASEWNNWFTHWQETISSDGRIFPLIPHRGNHEGENASDNPPFFELFDTTAENYYSFSIGGSLMRFYVLNSEMDNDAAKWNAQTSWLTNDLTANAASHTHLAAGYHKPMRPHTSSKSEGNNEYNAWAQPFFDHGMDLVLESDSHTVKRTWPIRPFTGAGSDEGFIRDDANGTVYSGEGCWGAPLRASNDLKNWTRDAGTFNSFDWVHVYPSYMELYTIKVDNADSVGSLQEGDVFSLPSNIDLWAPANGTRVIINNHAGASTKSYAQWQIDQWGSGAIPPNTEALADFDGDGYNNMTEFAYGLDPEGPAAADSGVFPVIAVESADIEINYRRTPNTSLTYNYEFSSDLVSWVPLSEGLHYSQSVAPTGSYEQVTIELLEPIEATSQGFIRVNVGIQ